jgi:hypothetical protein
MDPLASTESRPWAKTLQVNVGSEMMFVKFKWHIATNILDAQNNNENRKFSINHTYYEE